MRWFFIGLVEGAILGALGGTLDRGSLLILAPSGPPFWSLFGAFAGSMVGAVCGAVFPPAGEDAAIDAAEGTDSETSIAVVKNDTRNHKSDRSVE